MNGRTANQLIFMLCFSGMLAVAFDTTAGLLAEFGYVEGQNIRLEFRNTAGNVDELPALAREIVREGRVDVIIAISTPAALATY